VSLVHHAVQTLRRRARGSLIHVAAVICAIALLGGCGGSSHSTTRATGGSNAGVGESLRFDSCTDWRRATEAQRRATVAQLRKFAGGPVGSSGGIKHGPVLGDDRAYKILQSYCSNYFARGFKLYKLYVHAAGFVGQ